MPCQGTNENFDYKRGFSFTKLEAHLQKVSFIYKTGVLIYKWDSCLAIHLIETLK